MNKRELIARISEETQIPIEDSKKAVEGILDSIQESLAVDEFVKIAGFGTFRVSERTGREGRNPRSGEVIQIPPAKVPGFKASNRLKDNINTSMTRLERRKEGLPKIIAVTSGKGGVGKTNFVINSAISFAQKGLKTYIIDADLGTANVDVLLGVKAKYTIEDLINQTHKSIMDIVVDGPGGIKIIPGGSGVQSLTELSEEELDRVFDMFGPLEDHADVIIIDTGSGISRNVINFLQPADEIVVVVTPEPHSVTDAYALIKVLDDKGINKPVKMVFNMVDDLEEARKVAKKMLGVIGKFLDIKPYPLGYILKDDYVYKSVKVMKPFILAYPLCNASKNIGTITNSLNPKNKDTAPLTTTKTFLDEETQPMGFVAKLKLFFQK